MHPQQRLDPRLDSLPFRSIGSFQDATQCGQALNRHMAVIGPAQDILHFFDRGIEFFLEARLKAVGKEFHRIAKPFAGDANLVQLFVIIEIAVRRPFQGTETIQQTGPSQVEENTKAWLIRRRADRSQGLIPKQIPGLEISRADNSLQMLLCGGALTLPIAEEKINPGPLVFTRGFTLFS